MWKILIASVLGWLLLNSAAMAACTAIPNTFTNGQVADAGQVNANFSYVGGCAAPEASPAFTGNVGIGMSATNVLDITKTQNGDSIVKLLNASGGIAARSVFYAHNGTDGGTFQHTGMSFGPSSVYRADATLLLGNGTGGLTVGTTTPQPIYFSVNNTELARFDASGGFLVGTTVSGGWSAVAATELVADTGRLVLSVYNKGTSSAMFVRVGNTGADLINFWYNTNSVGTIVTNGTGTAYNTTSDARLKSNVVDLSAYKALRALKAYRPQEYLLRGKPGIGALAQEVDGRMGVVGIDAVALGIVTRGDRNAALKEGQPGFRQWSMDSAKMVPFIISTSLDHEDRLKALEAENVALTRQVRDLAGMVVLLERGRRAERQAAAPARTHATR